MKVKTVTAGEAALIIGVKLGPLSGNWTNCLADMLRGRKSDVCGVQLLPCAQQMVKGCWRPIYALADIMKFCEKVLTKIGERQKVSPQERDINPTMHWRMNKFNSDGTAAE